MATKKKKIPQFKSALEEGEFWDNHSATDYKLVAVNAEDVLEELQARHQKKLNVTFRLESDLMVRLKRRAKQAGIKYQTFVREWLWRAVL